MISTPLVSCIMPTYNRRRFVGQAIWYFLRQEYPSQELIIVDDGEDAIADLVPDDERIRYVRLDQRLTVGAKRNLACDLSQGELIAHWDDDDWIAPHRLRVQVAELLASDTDACGMRELLHYRPDAGEAWLYRYPTDGHGRPWLAGGTLLYRRSAWALHPFPELNAGEDTAFVWQFPPSRLHTITDLSLYVALLHGGNTSAKNLADPRWQRHPLGEVRRLLVFDRNFYVALRYGRPLPNPNRQHFYANRLKDGEKAQSSRKDISEIDKSWQKKSPLHFNKSRVTVSISYFQCKPYIRRAVESILGQTHANFTLVVVNDGDKDSPWDELAHIDDPRLVRFDLESNHGRYFADAVVLDKTLDPYFLIQDADDWSEPQRIARLIQKIREDHSDAAISACVLHKSINGEPGSQKQLTYPRLRQPLAEQLVFRSDHHALFKSDTLRRIGGYYGGFRIGYDTLIVNLLMMVGRVSYIGEPLYNRLVRSDSLTNNKATGMRSPARNQVHRQLQEMYNEAYEHYAKYLLGEIEAETLSQSIRQICNKRLTPKEHAELKEESHRLHSLLSSNEG